MKKRIIASILSFILVFQCFSPCLPVSIGELIGVKALAASDLPVVESGDWSYSLLETGASIVGYTGSDTEIVIPETIDGNVVVDIAYRAFASKKTITSVVFPAQLKSIGAEAFCYCTALASVDLPEGLTTIGTSAFYECTALTSVDFPVGLTTIGASAFYNCTALKTIVFPNSLTTIGQRAFSFSGLTEVTIPKSVTTTGSSYNGVFENCKSLVKITFEEGTKTIPAYICCKVNSLKTVVIPDSVTAIGNQAFYNCTALASVDLPDGLTYIGAFAFYNCTALKTIVFPNSLTTIGQNAFSSSGLTEVTIPKSVTTTGSSYKGVFENCKSLVKITFEEGTKTIPAYICCDSTNLKTVVIPDSVTAIGNQAFYNCIALASVDLPEGLITIGVSAFNDCTALKTIVYPNSLTTIGQNAFSYSGLTEVTIPKSVTTIDSTYNGIFENCINLEKIIFEDGTKTIPAYICNNSKYLKTVVIPDSVTAIGNQAFYNCTALKTIVFPNSLTTIGQNAFSNSGLTEVTIPKSVTLIQHNYTGAFADCKNLEKITFEEGTKTIPAYICKNSKYLKTVVIPDSVTSIGSEAFQNCAALTSVDLSDGLTYIGAASFYGCTALNTIVFPNSLTTIDINAFSYSGLTEVTIPKSVTTTGNSYNGVFENCINLEKITFEDGTKTIPAYICKYSKHLKTVVIPDSVTVISNQAFYNCTALNAIVFPNSLTTIGNGAFSNSGLTEVTIPKSITTTGSYYSSIFNDCPNIEKITFADGIEVIPANICKDLVNLKTVEIPNSVTVIGSDAFRNCASLETIVLPNSLTTIGNSAFSNSGLTEITIPKSVTTTGNSYNGVFDNCENLAKITFEDGAKKIPAYICKNSKNLKTVVIPDSVTSIGSEAFQNCAALTSVDLPDGLKRINDRAFMDCKLLSDIIIPDGIEHVAETAFVGCELLSSELQAGHVYSDWEIVKEATGFGEGLKERRCTLCSDVIKEAIPKLEYDLEKDSGYGLVTITVANADDAQPISGAQLYIVDSNGATINAITDSNGEISGYLPVGSTQITACFNGFKQRTIIYNITNTEQIVPTIGISSKNLVEGTVTVTEITPDEARDLGIDVNAEENQNIALFETKIKFKPEVDYESIFHYWNPSTKRQEIVPGKHSDGNSSWRLTSDGKGVRYSSGTNQKDTDITFYPITENFYLIIYGSVVWTKEMFNVELVLANNSATDTLSDISATINLPEGLSLAKMVNQQQQLTQTIDIVPKKASKSLNWYVCGDNAGDYDIEVSVSGKYKELNEKFSYDYSATDPIHVYAGEAMHITYQLPDSAFYSNKAGPAQGSGSEAFDRLYRYNIVLENTSEKTLYNLKFGIVAGQQIQEIKKVGAEDKVVVLSPSNAGNELTVDELLPGDKIVFSVETSILFDSTVIQNMKDEFCSYIDESTALMDDVNSLISIFSIIENCDSFLTSITQAAIDAEKMVENYSKAIQSFVDMAQESLQNDFLSVYPVLATIVKDYEKVINGEDCTVEEKIAFLKSLSAYAKYFEATIDNSYHGGSIDPWNAVKNMIQFIPIRYCLQEVVSFPMLNSTTEIPYSVEPIDVGPVYFGIDSVSDYITDILFSFFAEIMPNAYMSSFMKIDDTYREVGRNINIVEDKASKFIIRDADGKTAIDVKLVSSDGSTMDPQSYTYTINEDGTIDLEVSQEGEYTLNVVTGSGNEYSQNLAVLPYHKCACVYNITTVAPTFVTNGFIAHRCDICNKMLETKTIFACAEHDYGEEKAAFIGTCQEQIVYEKECKVCKIKSYRLGDYGNHEITTAIIDPSCTEYGKTIDTCNLCDYKFEYDFVDPLGHKYGKWSVIVEPDCENEGTKERICQRDSNHTEQKPVKPIGHSFGQWETVVEPTCEINGKRIRVCRNDSTHTETEDIESTGKHKKGADDKCIYCGECMHMCHSSNSFTSWVWKIYSSMMNLVYRILYGKPFTCSCCED